MYHDRMTIFFTTGATMYLSEGTARNYLSSAIQKLNAQNRVEAARIAEEKGWL